MKFCTNCGAEIADESKFCSNCGMKMEEIFLYLYKKMGYNPDNT